jgi:hypothetical protein
MLKESSFQEAMLEMKRERSDRAFAKQQQKLALRKFELDLREKELQTRRMEAQTRLAESQLKADEHKAMMQVLMDLLHKKE